MTKDDLKNAILDTEEEWIEEALPKSMGRKKRPARSRRRIALITAACALAALAAVILWPKDPDTVSPGKTVHAYALAEAQYPAMTSGDQFYLSGWDDYRNMTNEEIEALWARLSKAVQQDRKIFEQVRGSGENLKPFLQTVMAESLKGSGEENQLSAPLNLYLALAMLSEATAGESRQEILDLIGAESQETLREQAKKVWRANFYDNGYVKCVLGDSLWLSDQMEYREDCVNTISDSYYASVFRGEMGSKDYQQAFRNWINEQTGGLLKESVSELKLDKRLVLDLVSTFFFQDKWEAAFRAEETEKGVFHSPSGDKEAEFMKQTNYYGIYSYADGFGAYRKNLEDSDAVMYFILPDEGVSIDELLENEQLLAFLTDENAVPHVTIKVHFTLPKFDISQDRDLKSTLQSLGVQKVFEAGKADFSSLLTGDLKDESYVGAVQQGARIIVDEEGVKAAAYFNIPTPGAPMPPEDEIDFVLDRPFLFVLRSRDGLPLLAGVVNEP